MRLLVGVGAPFLTFFVLAGCGSTGPTASSTSSRANSAIAAQVPATIKANGTLTVATDADYAPNEFLASDHHTVVGMDPELMTALGALMGLKVKFVDTPFETIIPGLAENKYDVGASSITDTKKREQSVDFVDYYSAGTSFYEKEYVYVDVNTLADLCGKAVAVTKGTTQLEDATAQNAKCTEAGKKPVTVLAYTKQSEATKALVKGRAQIAMADSPVAAYQATESEPPVEVVGETYGITPYGFAIPKHSAMRAPIASALRTLIANGTYRQISDKWGIQAGTITTPEFNGATR